LLKHAHLTRARAESELETDRIRPWTELDWIKLGKMIVTTFLISNHCNTVDAISFQLKVISRIVSRTWFTSSI